MVKSFLREHGVRFSTRGDPAVAAAPSAVAVAFAAAFFLPESFGTP